MFFDDSFLIRRNSCAIVSQMGNKVARRYCYLAWETDNDVDRVIDNDIDCSQYGGVDELTSDTAGDNILGL